MQQYNEMGSHGFCHWHSGPTNQPKNWPLHRTALPRLLCHRLVGHNTPPASLSPKIFPHLCKIPLPGLTRTPRPPPLSKTPSAPNHRRPRTTAAPHHRLRTLCTAAGRRIRSFQTPRRVYSSSHIQWPLNPSLQPNATHHHRLLVVVAACRGGGRGLVGASAGGGAVRRGGGSHASCGLGDSHCHHSSPLCRVSNLTRAVVQGTHAAATRLEGVQRRALTVVSPSRYCFSCLCAGPYISMCRVGTCSWSLLYGCPDLLLRL